MLLMVSLKLCLTHSLTHDKLLIPTNVHINHQCSKRCFVINNDYFGTISYIPYLLGLIPKGRTNYVSFGTSTQGQDQPRDF